MRDWPYSIFHHLVDIGIYPMDLASGVEMDLESDNHVPLPGGQWLFISGLTGLWGI